MRLSYLHIALAILILASGCRKEPADSGLQLGFSAAAADASPAQTKGTREDDTSIRNNPFGIYAVYSASEGAASGTNVFDDSGALSVSYNTASGYWEYTRNGTNPKYYWKRNQYYRFRAYHPYSADVVTGASDADRISINYRIINDDYDLLVAFARRHPATEGYGRVDMNFRHALAALRFRVAFDSSVKPQDSRDEVTEFHIKGLQVAGNLSYTHNGDYLTEVLNWSTDDFDDRDEFYRWTGHREFGVNGYTPDGGTTVTPVDIFGTSGSDNVVFAIPQMCSDPSHSGTFVHFKTAHGTQADHSAKLPETQWEAGKIYTYTLLVKKSEVEVTVSIKDWNKVQSTLDIYY